MNRRTAYTMAVAFILPIAAGCSANQPAPIQPPTSISATKAAAQPITTTSDPVEHCLYESIEAYPTWPQPDQNVLDTLPACKNLPQSSKTHLRQMLAAFVAEANIRSAEGK